MLARPLKAISDFTCQNSSIGGDPQQSLPEALYTTKIQSLPAQVQAKAQRLRQQRQPLK